MIPVTIVSRFIECPQCQTVLRRGVPRFGPAKVECAKCGLGIETHLVPWQDIPSIKRVLVAIGEIIAPSRFGVFPYALYMNFLAHFLFGLVFVCVVLAFLGLVSMISKDLSTVLGVVAVYLAPAAIIALPVVRLVLLVRESNEYSATSVPPIWKASIF